MSDINSSRDERKREQARLYRLKNRATFRDYQREYRRRKREKVLAYERQWREKNRERTREYTKKWSRANPEKRRAYNKKNKKHHAKLTRRWYVRAKHAAIQAYGGKCVCCGEDRECFLTIDHVHNDGAQHRMEMRSGTGTSIYQWLRKRGYPQDGRYQVLCYNCNCAKQHDPIGHRAAHPNAKLIDGLGDDPQLLRPDRHRSQKSLVQPKQSQRHLWSPEEPCERQNSGTATLASAE